MLHLARLHDRCRMYRTWSREMGSASAERAPLIPGHPCSSVTTDGSSVTAAGGSGGAVGAVGTAVSRGEAQGRQPAWVRRTRKRHRSAQLSLCCSLNVAVHGTQSTARTHFFCKDTLFVQGHTPVRWSACRTNFTQMSEDSGRVSRSIRFQEGCRKR